VLVPGELVELTTLLANETVLAGVQAAANIEAHKPGPWCTVAPSKWLPVERDGVTHYIPLWK
jgi:hypothetical protein